MFSADAKDEIAAAAFDCPQCGAAFVRALAQFSKSRVARTAGAAADRVVTVTTLIGLARATLRAARSARFVMHARAIRERRVSRRRLVAVVAESPVEPMRQAPRKACCRRAWLRGAFLACGSVADPRRAYHIEFYGSDGDARALRTALSAFGIRAGLSRRRGRALVYARGASTVVDILAHLGAARAVLAFDDVLALRATKNAIRRRVNGEAANAARAASSAARQREAALRLNSGAKLGSLTPAISEAVRLRIARPTATLSELARAARPPVSKPAMGARMRAVERLARHGKSLLRRRAAGRTARAR